MPTGAPPPDEAALPSSVDGSAEGRAVGSVEGLADVGSADGIGEGTAVGLAEGDGVGGAVGSNVGYRTTATSILATETSPKVVTFLLIAEALISFANVSDSAAATRPPDNDS